jgi:hypothetical protein
MPQTSETIATRPPKLTRYQLPGFGLPLNFTPCDEYTTREYDFATKKDRETLHPALGDFGTLYPNTLDGQRAR